MKKSGRSISLHLDDLLRESPRSGTSMSMPVAIQHRLDVLAELAEATHASRAELIGMLIAEAPENAEELEKAVLAYRKATVRDVMPTKPGEQVPSDGDVVVPLRAAGRPRRAHG